MDVDTAYEKLLGSLPLTERKLAQGIVEGRTINASTALRPALRLELESAIQECLADAGNEVNLRRVDLYCDTLTIKPGTKIEYLHKRGFLIAIYARKIEAPSSGALAMHVNNLAALSIYSTEVPKDFQVTFIDDQAGQGIPVTFVPQASVVNASKSVANDDLGIRASFAEGKITSENMPVPDVLTTEAIDYTKRLRDDGTLDPEQFIDDNLARLIQLQLLLATSTMDVDRSLSLRLLNFVCSATNSASARDLNVQATALRSSILARDGSDICLVPSVNVFSSKTTLKARLLSAIAFEEAFRDFSAQALTSKQLSLFAGNAVDANKNALAEYAFLEHNARQAYKDAAKSLDVSSANYKTKQKEVQTAGDTFKKGIQKWKAEEEAKAARDILFGIVEIGLALAATVVTAGAAAPAVAITAAETASTVSTVVKLINKIKEIFEKVKKLWEKLQPLLEKIEGLVKAIKRMIEIVELSEKAEEMQGEEAPEQLKRADTTSDPINGNAMWDAFTVDVTVMFQELSKEDIDGKAEFEAALLKFPIFAKAYLPGQIAVVTSGQNLAEILLREKLARKQHATLEAAVRQIGTDQAVLDIFTRAMFDRVLAVRNLVFIDFWTYRAAYQYYSLNPSSDSGRVSPVQQAADFAAGAARLQAAVNSFGASTRIQRKSFAVEVPLTTMQVQGLTGDGSLTFAPAIDAPEFDGYCRIRLSRVRAFLPGAKLKAGVIHAPPGKTSSAIRLHLHTTGHFVDRDFPLSQRSKTDPLLSALVVEPTSPRSLDSQWLPRAFVGESRRVVFEYKLDAAESVTATADSAAVHPAILCDGVYGLRDDYTKQTPFQQWTLTVDKSQTLDLSQVAKVSLEFLCEVCSL